MSARRQAMEALRKEQEPERERDRQRERELAEHTSRQQARQIVKDRKLFEASPVANWFPESQWKVIAHFNGGTVFESQEESRFDRVRLRLNQEGANIVVVRFTPHERYLQDALNHWHRESVTIDATAIQRQHARQYSQMSGRHLLEHHGWWGPIVESAADVGRMIDKEDDIMRSMPDYLP